MKFGSGSCMNHHSLAPLEQCALGAQAIVPGLLPAGLLQRGNAQGWDIEKVVT